MSPRWSRIGAIAAGLVLLVCAPASAQDPLDRLLGQPIAAVELQVEGRAETSVPLLALIDIRPGDPFTIESYRRVTDRFNQVPRFETVRVLADERPTGLVIIFDLEPRHPIDRVEFPGDNTGLPPAELQRLVRQQFSGLPAFSRRSDVENAVQRILQDEGYWSAVVTSNVTRFHDPDRSTLNVLIEAGEQTVIGSITIEGESPLSRDEVLKELAIAPGSPYRERALASALAEIQDELRRRGYYTAIAQQQPAVITGTRADIVLMIRSGPLVRLRIEGRLPGSEDEFVPIKRQGSVDEDLLDDSRDQTARELRRQGYWRARVTWTESEPAPGELLITFVVERGKRYRVERVNLPAGLHVTDLDLAALPALEPGAWFSEEAVARAFLAVKALYQQDGYYDVRIEPKYDEMPGPSDTEGAVVINPNIVEGPRAVITKINFDLGDQPTVTASELRGIMRSKELTPPAPYVPAFYFYDQQAVLAHYESQGFLNRTAVIRPVFNEAGTEVVLNVVAREGPRVIVSEITTVGNDTASRELILREITLRIGQPYSEAARVESQRRLYNLGTFRTVSVTAQPRLPGETETRIIISVVETGSVTFGFGGGVEAGSKARRVEGGGFEDRLEFSPRASIDVGRRNLGGRNRAVNLFARVSLKPRNSEDPAEDGKGFGFTEYRVNGTYRERYAFRSETDLLFGVSSEQAVRTTFSYLRHGVNADLLRSLGRGLSVSGRYSLEVTKLFDERLSEDEQSLIDRLFPQVRLSMLSASMFRDRRDNQIAASRGSLASASVDFAPRWLGSEVGFVKGFIEVSYYRPVVAPRRAILALRGQVGLARGFERRVARVDDQGEPVLDPDGNPIVDVVADLPASQRFFAGGSNSVRGFQLDRLGVREVLDENGLSDGGNAMMVLNTELRVGSGRILGSDLTIVGFVDAGNVFDRVGELDLGKLRATTGFGVRVDSPFGPVRLDLGFKLDRFTFVRGRERRWEIHLSIGEVF